MRSLRPSACAGFWVGVQVVGVGVPLPRVARDFAAERAVVPAARRWIPVPTLATRHAASPWVGSEPPVVSAWPRRGCWLPSATPARHRSRFVWCWRGIDHGLCPTGRFMPPLVVALPVRVAGRGTASAEKFADKAERRPGRSYKSRIAPSTLNVGIAFSLGFVPQSARPELQRNDPGALGRHALSYPGRPTASDFSAMPGSSRWLPHYDRRWRGVLRRWLAWSARQRRGSAPPRHCRGW